MAQYRQEVDESAFVYNQVLVPGLRGEAIPVSAYEDPLTQGPLGPIHQVNDGYPFVYSASRIKSFAPAMVVQNNFVNGRYVGSTTKPYQFKSVPVAEINTRRCS